jgi:hypothetical protein
MIIRTAMYSIIFIVGVRDIGDLGVRDIGDLGVRDIGDLGVRDLDIRDIGDLGVRDLDTHDLGIRDNGDENRGHNNFCVHLNGL